MQLRLPLTGFQFYNVILADHEAHYVLNHITSTYYNPNKARLVPNQVGVLIFDTRAGICINELSNAEHGHQIIPRLC